MTTPNPDQALLDAYVAEIDSAVAVIASEIADLQAKVTAGTTVTPADFTAANTALTALQALEPPVAPTA
jgi:hypothetical protein